MKIRNGWVSNSSTSSFLIGFAHVINEELAKKQLANASHIRGDAEIYSYEDIMEMLKGDYEHTYIYFDDWCSVYPINDDVMNKYDKEDKFVVLNYFTGDIHVEEDEDEYDEAYEYEFERMLSPAIDEFDNLKKSCDDIHTAWSFGRNG